MAESFYASLFRNLADKIRNRGVAKAQRNADQAAANGESQPVASPKLKGKGLGPGVTNIDLTPIAFKEAVKSREFRKRWIFIDAGLVALIVLLGSSLYVTSLPVQSSLDSQQKSNQQLQQELSKYQTQTDAVDQQGATKNKLNQAAGGAINWATLISAIEDSLPSGTSVSSFGINTSSSAERGASLRISFSANSPLGYADTLKAVQSASGVSNVQIGGMTASGDSYEFTATLNYDSSIKTNRFPASNGGN